jgi:oxygen-dependent protoporphyrinogen oxidase
VSARTIVVGGGIGGLAAAYRLARAGQDVRVLEGSSRPGGIVRTEHRDGYLLEAGPNTVRPTAPLWALVQDLGLGGEVLLADSRATRYVDFEGRLLAVPMSPWALARTPLLSAGAKLRLLTEPLRPRGASVDESVRDFVARRLGAEVADRLVEPLIAGIFAGSAQRLSLAAAFPRLARWERENGSLLAGALADRRLARSAPPLPKGLLSFRGGLERLPRALAAALGDGFSPDVDVRRLLPGTGRWQLETSVGLLEAERVIVTAPAWAAAPLIERFAPEAAEALAGIAHPPLATLHLSCPEAALARPLEGFGHLVAPSAARRILGAVWSSSVFPGRAPAGRALLTVFLGGTRDPEVLALGDEDLSRLAARDLRAEGLLRADPETVMVTRYGRAIPQYERGHGDRMRRLTEAETRFPGLRLAGNYRAGVAVGDVIAAPSDAASSP